MLSVALGRRFGLSVWFCREMVYAVCSARETVWVVCVVL